MNKTVPKIIKDNGFDFRWDNHKVWTLELPIEEIEVIELEWIFDIPFWSDGTAYYNLTAKQVIENPDKYIEHEDRLEKCNTSYPIDIMKNSNDQWLILDGLHRLVKLVIYGNEIVKVRKVSRDLIPNILK